VLSQRAFLDVLSTLIAGDAFENSWEFMNCKFNFL
jgi:hypothetical protein